MKYSANGNNYSFAETELVNKNVALVQWQHSNLSHFRNKGESSLLTLHVHHGPPGALVSSLPWDPPGGAASIWDVERAQRMFYAGNQCCSCEVTRDLYPWAQPYYVSGLCNKPESFSQRHRDGWLYNGKQTQNQAPVSLNAINQIR